MSSVITSLHPPANWLGARARNVFRHPLRIAAATAGVLPVTLAVFLTMPRQKPGSVPRYTAPVTQVDTLSFAQAVAVSAHRAATAESALGDARTRALAAAAIVKATVDTLDPAMIARRDSLAAVLASLETMLTTAETAPLPSSYRSLAGSPALNGNARVRSLLDSLSDIERERDAMGAGGGTDPIFAALTSRITDIGRMIQAQGEDRRLAIREQLSSATVSSPHRTMAAADVVDTVQWLAELDSARSVEALATQQLVAARGQLMTQQDEAKEVQAEAAAIAPLSAILASAAVFALVIAFGAVLVSEMRRPRVGDGREVEELTGVPALATVRPRISVPTRTRRLADRTVPHYIDPTADAHQVVWLNVAHQGVGHMALAIVGDDSRIAALVAVNLAAIAAGEARTAVVVDADPAASVSGALGMPSAPGMSDVGTGRSRWEETVISASVGRDRTIDVIPAGARTLSPADLSATIAREGGRLSRRYDAVFVVATPAQVSAGLAAAMPAPETIICAQVGRTVLAKLSSQIETLRGAGSNVVGVVLWDAPRPVFSARRPATQARPPLRPRGAESTEDTEDTATVTATD